MEKLISINAQRPTTNKFRKATNKYSWMFKTDFNFQKYWPHVYEAAACEMATSCWKGILKLKYPKK